MTNATLAMYPVSSRSDRKKNMTTMIGMNESTVPTPSKIPSMTSDLMTELTFHTSKACATTASSADIPLASRFCRNAPTTLNVSQKMTHIMPINAGIPVYFPVRKRSIRSERFCSLLTCGFTTHLLTSFSIKSNRISAMAAARSSPRSSSI